MATETVDFANMLAGFGPGEGWKWDKGSWWLETPADFDVRANAAALIAHHARFVAITAMEREDKEIRLYYQWDLDGKLLSFTTATKEKKIASIVDLCPAADWVERETYEYFAVEFTGRASLQPLMMRAGDEVGINLRKEATA
jgi:NADH:ubiquinone oxidoreductase subunit C